MARRPMDLRRRRMRYISIMCMMFAVMFVVYMTWYFTGFIYLRRRQLIAKKKERKLLRIKNLGKLINENDRICVSQLRMDRRTFGILCEMLRDIGGLGDSRNMSLQEIVSMFLYTIAHHQKNRTIGNYFDRSGETVSRQFHLCLKAILKLHRVLFKTPEPIAADCTDDAWRCFKNCLGALDGTFIRVIVSAKDKPRYRTRKSDIATNVLGVCSPDMQFIYVLPGWEGSAHDARVLRDAISRPNGLRVPQGCYYLVDSGYTNREGFLAPYRGQRYHLNEWRNGRRPQSAEEYFNKKHAQARNVMERCFGLLKGRWAILRSPSFFPIQTQCRIIMACCLLHNLIRRYMHRDPIEEEEEEENEEEEEGEEEQREDEVEYITTLETSDHWTNFRNILAQQMFNNWRSTSFMS